MTNNRIEIEHTDEGFVAHVGKKYQTGPLPSIPDAARAGEKLQKAVRDMDEPAQVPERIEIRKSPALGEFGVKAIALTIGFIIAGFAAIPALGFSVDWFYLGIGWIISLLTLGVIISLKRL